LYLYNYVISSTLWYRCW